MAFSGKNFTHSAAKPKRKRAKKGEGKRAIVKKPVQSSTPTVAKPKFDRVLSRADIPFGPKCYTVIGKLDGKNTKIQYCPFYCVAKFNEFYFPYCNHLKAGSISARFDVADMKKEGLLDTCIELETNQQNQLTLKEIWDYRKECQINEDDKP